eukprot:CAMPEP_0172318692 /NCGR_PEP_ID=MMETSP1058-20130122/35544_1 /TAXON_ID=83371 /ORGANISM="Detonula confervacea, Strain CCMP 353" /LENGTH=559 /DNA_ID=CAMNT_0013033575 /DNA_START=37 /DNA_END=1713 /DNA_ORIENTATION=+
MGRLSSFLVVTAVATSCHPTSLTPVQMQSEAFSPGNISSRKRPNHDRRRISSSSSPFQHRANSASSAARVSVICHSAGIAGTSIARRVIGHGVTTFMSNWKAYSLIPLVAGFVGWFTNYLAVQMIFYPIRWRGIPIYKVEGEPLGLIGWQGIIPAKTMKMTEALVNTTINDLLTMEEIIQRLDPDTVADILLPLSGQIVQPFVDELLADKPKALIDFASDYTADTDGWVQQKVAHKFLRDLTVDVQKNIGSICNLRNCVVDMMMYDRSLLGKLFEISGKDELQFLVDSGLLLGFILGLIQLVISLYWNNPWTLSVGGLVVGLATNWLALKWIFEPVNPFKIGPIVLQGLFLRRQNEVSADFSKFFANKVLTSRQLWKSMLTDPTTLPEWEKLMAKRFSTFAKDLTFGAVDLAEQKPRKLNAASARVCRDLFDNLTDLHGYVDEALEIEKTLRARMMAMSSAQFERVLHPIFEEDEMTLILSGGGLGFMAGLIQQLLSTGSIVLPRLSFGGNTNLVSLVGTVISMYVVSVALKPRQTLLLFVTRLIQRTRRLKKKTHLYW